MAHTPPKVTMLENLDSSELSAGDLCETTGLSYRQLNEWDKRDSLPHERKGTSGWRKFTFFQATALKIVSVINQKFGTPLVKQQDLLNWMLGEEPTVFEYLRFAKAEDLLFGFTDEEKDENNRDLAEQIKQGGIHIREFAGAFSDEKPIEQIHDPLQSMIQAMTQAVVPRLVERGWAVDKAESFSERFFTISLGQRHGQKIVSEFVALRREAQDWPSKLAVHVLGSAVCPLLDLMGMMSSGFRVYLVTNLEEKYFLSEPYLMDLVKIHGLPQPAIVLEVNDDVNAILQAAGKKAFPLKIEASAIEQSKNETLSQQEQRVLKLLRDRKFDRLIVEAKDNIYRVEIQRDVSVEDEKQVAALIKAHEYQTVTVKTQHGKVVRVSQSISMKMDSSATTERSRLAG